MLASPWCPSSRGEIYVEGTEPDSMCSLHSGSGEISPAAVASPGSGRGLLGMRERAAVFGGSLDAQPTPTGFRVAARLPLETEPAAS